jgi:hypothetical protein
MAVRHHDDHRPGAPGGDQVVEDLHGPAETRPFPFVAAIAVQQVEHGIPRLRRLVSRRRVHQHPPLEPEGRRLVPNGRERAVRDVAVLVERRLGARHEEQVLDAKAIAQDIVVLGIDGRDAVHQEPIRPEFGSQGTRRRRPDSAGILRHRDARAVRPVAADTHARRFGSI